jgi:endonuclease-3
VKRYQTLLSLMLSSQTRDEVNHAAMKRLKDAQLASLDGILAVSEEELAEFIKPVSFYKVRLVYCSENR